MTGQDHRTAGELARAAGDLLLSIRRQGAAGPALGRLGDIASHDHLVAEIRSRHPDDAILSEESVDDRRRLGSRRVWIIDPLDGTREVTELPRDDWPLRVALWQAGGKGKLLGIRTRPPGSAWRGATAIGAECVPMGSAGAKTASVILGEAAVYLHAGGQNEWDSAAPAGVALKAGLHASRLSGEPLVYNRDDVSVPDLLVCRRNLAPMLLGAIADATRDLPPCEAPRDQSQPDEPRPVHP